MLILLNTLGESNIPVIAPSGESNRDNPRLPSVKPSLSLIPGIEATQVPNNKLEAENKKPTASAGLNLKKDFINWQSTNFNIYQIQWGNIPIKDYLFKEIKA